MAACLQILADQLTLFQPGGRLCPPPPPGFQNYVPTLNLLVSLVQLQCLKSEKKERRDQLSNYVSSHVTWKNDFYSFLIDGIILPIGSLTK